MAEIVVLVSAGRNPINGRARHADLDARGVELALRLADARVHLLHCGSPEEPALRDYAGMGVSSTTVLRCAGDVVPPLTAWLMARNPALILAGLRGEAGEDSGLLPYRIAEALGRPLLAGIVDLEAATDGWRGTQLLKLGRRRLVSTSGPAVATVAPGAPAPRLSAFARAQRAVIDVLDATTGESPAVRREDVSWEKRPARRRPKRLIAPGSAPQRVRTGAVEGVSAEEAAEMIWAYLVQGRIVAETGTDLEATPAPAGRMVTAT